MPFRAFLAVDLEDVPRLAAFGDELRRTGATLRVVPPENLHLTLKFLGDTPEARVPAIREAMVRAAEAVDPFEARLQGTGAFPGLQRINVVWVGVEPAEPFARLAGGLDEGLQAAGFRRDRRPFAAHATVARVKGSRRKGELVRLLRAAADRPFGAVTVDRIRLKRSVLGPDGPTYATVEEVPLGGRDG